MFAGFRSIRPKSLTIQPSNASSLLLLDGMYGVADKSKHCKTDGCDQAHQSTLSRHPHQLRFTSCLPASLPSWSTNRLPPRGLVPVEQRSSPENASHDASPPCGLSAWGDVLIRNVLVSIRAQRGQAPPWPFFWGGRFLVLVNGSMGASPIVAIVAIVVKLRRASMWARSRGAEIITKERLPRCPASLVDCRSHDRSGPVIMVLSHVSLRSSPFRGSGNRQSLGIRKTINPFSNIFIKPLNSSSPDSACEYVPE